MIIPNNVNDNLMSAEINMINIFHDYMGIKYLSKKQKQAFESHSRLLIITGCSSSGESLMTSFDFCIKL